jgi:hypothetical protein
LSDFLLSSETANSKYARALTFKLQV